MREYTSTKCVASNELLIMLRRDYRQPNDWAHSLLTQAFKFDDDSATAVLTGELDCLPSAQKFCLPTACSTSHHKPPVSA